MVPEDEDADPDTAEGEEDKNLSGTGETDSCLIAGLGVGEGMAGEFVSDDVGVGRILPFRTGVAAAAVVTAARAVPAIAFCFFASFNKLWSTVN